MLRWMFFILADDTHKSNPLFSKQICAENLSIRLPALITSLRIGRKPNSLFPNPKYRDTMGAESFAKKEMLP